MVKRKDPLWEHAEDLNGRHFVCKFCHHKFSGGITRFKSHLSGITGRGIQICPKVPEALQAITARSIRNERLVYLSERGRSVNIGLNHPAPNEENLSAVHPAATFTTLERHKNAVDEMLAKFVFANRLPGDITQIPYLSDFVRSIAEFGSGYKLPDYATYKSKSIPGIEKEVNKYVANVEKFLPTTGCTVMMYPAAVKFKLDCVTIFAYTPGGLIYIDTIETSGKGITLGYFISSIYSAIESLGAEHVVQFIFTDIDDLVKESIIDFGEDADSNASLNLQENFNLYMLIQDMIFKKYPWIYWTRCTTRELEHLLTVIYFEVPWVRKTAELGGLIFKYFYKNGTNLLLRNKRTSKPYYSPLMMKIATEIFMLNSLLEEEKELLALHVSIAPDQSFGREGSSIDHDVAKFVDTAIHATDFWSRGEKVLQVLKPLFQVLNLVYCHGPNIGYLYEAMKRADVAIKQHCINPNDDEKVHLEAILRIFNWHIHKIVHPIHAAAAFLNPAYMWSKEFVEDPIIEEGLTLMNFLVIEAEKEAFAEQLQLYRIKTPTLFTDTAIKFLNTLHPRKWWEICGDGLPILQKYAVRLLSQPCSSSICDPLTFRMPDDELIMNISAMELFDKMRPQELGQIDLEKVGEIPRYDDVFIQICLDSKYSETCDYYALLVINDPESFNIQCVDG